MRVLISGTVVLTCLAFLCSATGLLGNTWAEDDLDSLRRAPDFTFVRARILGDSIEVVGHYLPSSTTKLISEQASTLYERFRSNELQSPEDTDLFNRLLICYSAASKHDYLTCRENASIALGMAPDSLAPWRFLSISNLQLGRLGEAERGFLRILSQRSNLSPFLKTQTNCNTASLYIRQGRLQTARIYLDHAIQENRFHFWEPELGAAYNSLAIWHQLSGDFDSAAIAYRSGQGSFLLDRYRQERFALSSNSSLLDVWKAESRNRVEAAIRRFEGDKNTQDLPAYDLAEIFDNISVANIQLVKNDMVRSYDDRAATLLEAAKASLEALQRHKHLERVDGIARDHFHLGWCAAQKEFPVSQVFSDTANSQEKEFLESLELTYTAGSQEIARASLKYSFELAQDYHLYRLAASACSTLARLETEPKQRVLYLFDEMKFRALMNDGHSSYAVVENIGDILANVDRSEFDLLSSTLEEALKRSKPDYRAGTSLAISTRKALETKMDGIRLGPGM